MSRINDLHARAMEHAEQAILARMRGETARAVELFKKALESEVAAIEELQEYSEPTHSILHRSAGTLALDCNDLCTAEQMAARALAKEPPPDIAQELRDLLEQVRSRRRVSITSGSRRSGSGAMTENKTSVSDLMSTALVLARQQHSSTMKAWVGASVLVGGLLPKSIIMASVQRIGKLDVMIRCMEDEAQADMKRVQENMWTTNLHSMLAGVWVCELYEVFRLLKSRRLVVGSDAFDLLTDDLRALRVTISKHEIAADRKLPGPILMKPEGADDADAYEYRTGDPQRAHIMSMGLSFRGSVMWQAIDGTSVGSPRWLERRSLSERTLQLLSDDGSLSSQE